MGPSLRGTGRPLRGTGGAFPDVADCGDAGRYGPPRRRDAQPAMGVVFRPGRDAMKVGQRFNAGYAALYNT
jgi:hypothetical protein